MKTKKLLFNIIVLLGASLGLQAQNFKWVKSLGNTVSEIRAIETDSLRNVFIAGRYSGTIDADPGTGVTSFTSLGFEDVFFAKYDTSGNLLWAESFGGSNYDICSSMKLDPAGNIYIAGTFKGTADFDPGTSSSSLTSAGNLDVFFAKYDASGNFVWAQKLGGTGDESSSSLDVDAAGNVFLSGGFQYTVDFDPGAGTSSMTSASYQDGFYAKYDASGNLKWARQLSTPFSVNIVNIAAGPGDNVYISGNFSDTIDFDPGPGVFYLNGADTMSSTMYEIFIAKYDSSGNFIWAVDIDSTEASLLLGVYGGAKSMHVDPAGSVYIAGRFNGTGDFDPYPGFSYILTGYYDAFIAKYSPAGNFIWAKNAVSSGLYNEQIYGIDEDLSGNIYVTGFFEGTSDFDPGAGVSNLTSAGSMDMFFAKYDPSGNYIWAAGTGGTSVDINKTIHVDDKGNVYVIGGFAGTADFDPAAGTANVTSGGGEDYYFAKYSQDICDEGILSITGFSNIACAGPGGASVSMLDGTPPYTYFWNTTPVITTNSISITIPGFYDVVVTDANGCEYTRSILVTGPDSAVSLDLNVNLVSSNYRPGIPSIIHLDGYNAGCVPVSGSVVLVLDPLLTYNSSSPIPSAISGDSLIWNFTNLTYDSPHITPTVIVTTSTSAALGDSIDLHATISYGADESDSTNNVKDYQFLVINSYDPNDKQVYPRGFGATGMILNNQKMTYTIRFQNVGNAEAINVTIIDTIDADLNFSTLEVTGTSHDMVPEVLPGNVMKFRFDNINLPDSTTNEALSQGYVIYEIQQQQNLSDGTEITNTADIYFDFNLPVTTNTVLNTIGTCWEFPIAVSQTGNVLATNTQGVSYQWLTCDGSILITGATNPTYVATANGTYAVIVNVTSTCADTSACLTVNSNSISEAEMGSFKVSPNPATGSVILHTGEIADDQVELSIVDVFGRTVYQQAITRGNDEKHKIDMGSLQNGIYLVNLKGERTNAYQRIVLQK